MAIPWIVALKSIPWGTVIEHGPKVFDKARDMVNRRREAKEATSVYTAPEKEGGRPLSVEELAQQVKQIQLVLSDLALERKELGQSVIELTQQNQQLAVSIGVLRRRVAFLVLGLVVTALVMGWKMWVA